METDDSPPTEAVAVRRGTEQQILDRVHAEFAILDDVAVEVEAAIRTRIHGREGLEESLECQQRF